MHKIPVTVITGFLGAGKTTLVRHLLQNAEGRRIAVLVNEFGEVGIDGDLLRSCQVCDDDPSTTDSIPSSNSTIQPRIVELTNGCLCCTVQEEFLPTMQILLERRDQLDCIVIETSGLALPKPLVQAFRWPEIRNGATVDGVITVVDCEAIAHGTFVSDVESLDAQRQADPNLDHDTPIEELFEDQLACADLVLLTKTDLVEGETQAAVRQQLHDQLPSSVKVVACDRGTISPDVLLGFNAAVEDQIDQRPSHHDHDDDHDHDDSITAVQILLDQAFDPGRLVQCLQSLVQDCDIYRIKGFVAVPNKPMRLVLHGVGKRFDHFYDRPWQASETRQTKLVFIGHNLDQALIEAAISAARAETIEAIASS
ncbi:MAG: cobalamin biosynthesis protein CobW [Elainellaceae cyanobacterium]